MAIDKRKQLTLFVVFVDFQLAAAGRAALDPAQESRRKFP